MIIGSDESTRLQAIYAAVVAGNVDASCVELRTAVHDAFLSWYALLADGVVTNTGLRVPDRYVTDDVVFIVDAAEVLFVNQDACTGEQNDRVFATAQRVLAIEPGSGPGFGTNIALIVGVVVAPIILGVMLGKLK